MRREYKMKKKFLSSVAFIVAAVCALGGCPMPGDDDASPAPPERPEKPGAIGGDGQLMVSWNKVENATAYEVWYAPESESNEADPAAAEQYVETISALKLVLTGLENGTAYHVWIKAKNAGGISDFSEPVKESPKAPARETVNNGDDNAPLPPEPPGKPVASGGDGQLVVSWNKVENATAYEVWYAPESASAEADPAAAVQYVETISALKLVLTGLENGTAYHVWIKAKNAGGTSDFSEPVKESPKAPASEAENDNDNAPLPPEPPGKPVASGGDKQLVVSWNKVETATAYEVWHAPAVEGAAADPLSAAQYVETISALKLVLTGLENGTAYHVWIKAKNAGGISDFSEPVTESPRAPLSPPTAPEDLALTAEGRSIKAAWTPSPQATGYEVYYSGGAALPGTSPVTVEGGDTGFALIPGLDDNTTYYVWVKARNSAGVSGDSAVKSCVTNKGEKAITAFAIGETQGIIDETAKTISLLAPFATDLAQAAPLITLSPDATVSPASGSVVDFSGGEVEFTVTAQNGTTEVYKVSAKKKGQAALALTWKPNQGFSDPGEGAFATEELSLAKTGSYTADIDLQGSFAAYEWYVDNSLKGQGTLHEDETPEISLDARDYFTGSHRLDIIVHDAAGVPYSKGLNFEVED
jgi:hypothetical protein